MTARLVSRLFGRSTRQAATLGRAIYYPVNETPTLPTVSPWSRETPLDQTGEHLVRQEAAAAGQDEPVVGPAFEEQGV